MSVNKVILVGNVGKDPDVRYLDNGVAVASFPLATSETYKDKTGEKHSSTEWHNIVLWRGLAEITEKYVKKGKQIYLEGKIRSRSWEDKEGNKRYITEVIGDNMQFLGKREDSPSEKQEEKKTETTDSTDSDTDDKKEGDKKEEDDLPF